MEAKMSLIVKDKYGNKIPRYQCPECAGKVKFGGPVNDRRVYVNHKPTCKSGYRNALTVKGIHNGN